MVSNFDKLSHNDNKDDGALSNYRILFMYNILISGRKLSYGYVKEVFETSLSTWKRDIKTIKYTIESLYEEDVKIIKLKNEKAYILFISSNPLKLYIA